MNTLTLSFLLCLVSMIAAERDCSWLEKRLSQHAATRTKQFLSTLARNTNNKNSSTSSGGNMDNKTTTPTPTTSIWQPLYNKTSPTSSGQTKSTTTTVKPPQIGSSSTMSAIYAFLQRIYRMSFVSGGEKNAVHRRTARSLSPLFPFKNKQNNSRKKKATVQNDIDEIIDRIYPYAKDLESLLNFQIRNEMNAFYNYLSMAHFFGTEENDMEGFYAYFHAAAMEELKHAEMFMKYQAKRGARNTLYSLPAPERQTWKNGVQVLKSALVLEKNVTDEVLCLHKLANDKYNDVDLVNFLEGEVIPEQYEGMKEIASHIKSINRMAASKEAGGHKNYGLAEHHYDLKLKELAAKKK